LSPYDDTPHNFSAEWDEATLSFPPYIQLFAADDDNDCVASNNDEEAVESAFQSEAFFVEAAEGLSPWWMEDEVVGTHNKGEEEEKKEEPLQYEDEHQTLHQTQLEEAARIERELCVLAVMLQQAEDAALAFKEKEHQLQLKSEQSRSLIHMLDAVIDATAHALVEDMTVMEIEEVNMKDIVDKIESQAGQGQAQNDSSIGDDDDEEEVVVVKVDFGTFSFMDIPSLLDRDKISDEDGEEGEDNAANALLAEEIHNRSSSTDTEEARFMAYWYDVIGEEARQLEEHLAQLSNDSVAVLPAKKTELRETETKAPAIDNDEKEKEAVDCDKEAVTPMVEVARRPCKSKGKKVQFADNKDIKSALVLKEKEQQLTIQREQSESMIHMVVFVIDTNTQAVAEAEAMMTETQAEIQLESQAEDGIREDAAALEPQAEQAQEQEHQDETVVDMSGAFSIMDRPSLIDQDHSSDEDVDEKEEHNTDGMAEETREAEIEQMRLDNQECRISAEKGLVLLNPTESNDSEAAEEARLVTYGVIGEEARQLEEIFLAQFNIAINVASPEDEEKEEAATRAPIVDQEKEVEATSAVTSAAEEQEQEQQREEVEEYNMKRQGSFRMFSESLKLRDAEQARMAEGFRRAIASQKGGILLAKCEELKREAEQKEQWRLRLAREAQEALQRHVAACMTAEEARLVSNVVCAHNEVMPMAEVASRPRVTMSFFEHYESEKYKLEQNEGMNMAQAARKLYGIHEPEIGQELGTAQ
jgi:hypothetical protein